MLRVKGHAFYDFVIILPGALDEVIGRAHGKGWKAFLHGLCAKKEAGLCAEARLSWLVGANVVNTRFSFALDAEMAHVLS